MSFHVTVSSGASTVDGLLDSDIEESVSRTLAFKHDLQKIQSVSDDHILTLAELDEKLSVILSKQDDPEKLVRAKALLESYRGSDWTMHRRLPVQTPDFPNGYERVLVARREGLYDLLVLSWSEVNSPIHDHPCERCFLMPLCGEMIERRYEKAGDGSLTLVHSVPIPNGEASWIDDSVGYHSVGNPGTGIACSLHCYIPGFTRSCTIFDPEAVNNPAVVGETIKVRSRAATWSVCNN
jgi:hypothetical protein